MLQMHDMADSFDEALAQVRGSLSDAQRQLAAWSLMHFPDRLALNAQAADLRQALKASCVEVNAISRESQVTVGSAPVLKEPRVIPVADSLCVVAASLGKPLAVDDIPHDPVVARHAVLTTPWLSWASSPIAVGGFVAGTVCALQHSSVRHWTLGDQEALEATAGRIGKLVETWAGAS